MHRSLPGQLPADGLAPPSVSSAPASSSAVSVASQLRRQIRVRVLPARRRHPRRAPARAACDAVVVVRAGLAVGDRHVRHGQAHRQHGVTGVVQVQVATLAFAAAGRVARIACVGVATVLFQLGVTPERAVLRLDRAAHADLGLARALAAVVMADLRIRRAVKAGRARIDVQLVFEVRRVVGLPQAAETLARLALGERVDVLDAARIDLEAHFAGRAAGSPAGTAGPRRRPAGRSDRTPAPDRRRARPARRAAECSGRHRRRVRHRWRRRPRRREPHRRHHMHPSRATRRPVRRRQRAEANQATASAALHHVAHASRSSRGGQSRVFTRVLAGPDEGFCARARDLLNSSVAMKPGDSLQELLPIADLALPLEGQPPKTRRIYCNRDLRLDQIEAIGFDMDYTLAIYKQAEMDRLSIEATASKLVALGYPEALRNMHFRAHFPIRGLLVDTKLGNVLKTDRYRYAKKAYHGTRELSSEERKPLYQGKRIRPGRAIPLDRHAVRAERGRGVRGRGRRARASRQGARLRQAVERRARVHRRSASRRHDQGRDRAATSNATSSAIRIWPRRCTSCAARARSCSC